VDFRERIVVDGHAISPEEVVEFIARYTADVERLGASFFEATTAMAFAHFDRAGVDVALVETGLGGRLDSTNVVHPVAAGVTAIGYDHMEYLGDTLRQIAGEKAGIFKRGVPAVIGEPDPEVRSWLAEGARAAGASRVVIVAEETSASDIALTRGGTRFRLAALGDERVVETPLVGRHQAANFAFTLALLEAAGPPFASTLVEAADAVRSVRLPGRFQRAGRWIFDVAHNADGARTLAASIGGVGGDGEVTVVLCVLADKDWRAMLDALAAIARSFVLTNAPTAPANRRWDLEEVAAYATRQGYRVRSEPDFQSALDTAGASGGTVLVTGSFHTVGDAMSRLQLSPLQD
jgi:dihydrofolate synthase/folylpolyglutamate synthase